MPALNVPFGRFRRYLLHFASFRPRRGLKARCWRPVVGSIYPRQFKTRAALERGQVVIALSRPRLERLTRQSGTRHPARRKQVPRMSTQPLSTKRRVGTEQSAMRATILDATEALMVEAGYAAVSTRRVATQAGVKPALIQYYFLTMDDLLLAAYRRAADRSIQSQVAALASSRPLHAL